jgi:hypothetical protein
MAKGPPPDSKSVKVTEILTFCFLGAMEKRRTKGFFEGPSKVHACISEGLCVFKDILQ